MPAYFSVIFEYSKDRCENHIASFYTSLSECGLSFQSGYWGAEGSCLDEIIQWNQDKMKDNFELGFSEHFSHDYKQAVFKFQDFSEARVYIFNDRKSESFQFHFIIPEDDFLRYEKENDCRVIRLTDRMCTVENLAVLMWEKEDLLSVQTGWEYSDCAVPSEKLAKGSPPNIEPFAIVPSKYVKRKWASDNLIFSQKKVGREGMLLINDDNWLHTWNE